MKTTFSIFLFLLYYIGYTQSTLAHQFATYSTWMDTAKAYNINLSVDVFFSKKDTIPSIKLTGSINKSTDVYYAELYGNETLVEGKKMLWINNKQKVMIYKPNAVDLKKQKPEKDLFAAMDSAIMLADSVIVQELQGGEMQYNVISYKGVINSMYLSFDSSGRIVKTLYYYNEEYMESNNKVAIHYKYENASLPTTINMQNFISYRNSNVLPSEKYKSYQLKIQ